MYLDEYVFRFNRRRNPMAAFQTVLGLGSQQAPTTYAQITAAGPAATAHSRSQPDKHDGALCEPARPPISVFCIAARV